MDQDDNHWVTTKILEALERIARVEERLGPLQMVVYGLVAIVMTTIVVGLLSLVLVRN